MHFMAVTILLALGGNAADIRPDGTIYRAFDPGLMAKITAASAAKRDAARQYDPATWLPVEPKPTAYTPRPPRDESAERHRREARMRMVATRNEKRRQRSAVDPMAWIFNSPPPMSTKPCPWASYNYAMFYSRR